MSKKKFEEFVIKLSEDSQLNKSYVENPEAVMKDFGLEDNEIRAVLKGETKEVEKLIGTKAVCIHIVTLMKDDK
ncbi:hypothetical protein [Kangiella sediminilitoris]|uniref:Extradiol ring-cleavage dioxygenase LigAB LigA subunit domain-containing protein n=1 Tax=Kangiella sediminilitoris TaxID=1144748 RepID=A0A1B3B7X4_9GAMM|nr:hypothetical protein [Kangiella sediminilitoris]AOE48891.1 hypothetical protein KS2013_162 [Kangiella sediminilitoris]